MVSVSVEPKTVVLSDAKPIEVLYISVDGRQRDAVNIYIYFFREYWGYGWEEVFRLTNQCCIPLYFTLSTYVCNMSYRGRYKVRVVDVNTGEVAEEEVVVESPWEEPRERYAREEVEKARQIVQAVAQQIAQILQPQRPPPTAPEEKPPVVEKPPEEEEKEKPPPVVGKPLEEAPPEEKPPVEGEPPVERPAPTPVSAPAKPSPLGLLVLLMLLLSESK
jgi:hypothetical protein